MKKIYLSILSMAIAGVMCAQTSVTLNLDMSGQTVSGSGVHVAGNFGDLTTGLPVWDPASSELTDDDSDGIYSITLNLNPGVYQFKFVNGNAWGSDEGSGVPVACRAAGSDNRELVVGTEAMEVEFGWQACGPVGQKVVRFRVDMSNQTTNPLGVYVAGDFQGWNPGGSPLYDADNNGVWEAYYSIGTASSVEFKYVNGNSWENPNENITGACGNGTGNRFETITETNTVLPMYCYNACDPCTQPAAVTFRVDMSQQTVGGEGVFLAGNFASAGYVDWAANGIAMTDGDSDGIYEVVLNLPNGTYQFKFVNSGAWESVPSGCVAENGNRGVTVENSDPISIQACFEQCSEICIANPDPADITFSVNMSNQVIDPAGPRLIGSFTNPAWQDGQITLQESSVPGIWYATVTVSGAADIAYKFVNGVASSSDESNAESNISECGVGNGLGGFNRVHTRSGEAEVLTTPCFDSCEICGTIISVEEKEVVKGLLVYPNPVEDVLNISFANPTAQKITIALYNNLGQNIMTQDLGVVAGQRMLQVNTAQWSTGIYSLAISNGINNQVVRLNVK